MTTPDISQQTNDQAIILAVNSVRHVGQLSRIIGIIAFAISPIAFLPYMLKGDLAISIIVFVLTILMGIFYVVLGTILVKLPPYDKTQTYLIVLLAVSILLFMNILTIILVIMTIIAMTKLSDYRRWSNGEFERAT